MVRSPSCNESSKHQVLPLLQNLREDSAQHRARLAAGLRASSGGGHVWHGCLPTEGIGSRGCTQHLEQNISLVQCPQRHPEIPGGVFVVEAVTV